MSSGPERTLSPFGTVYEGDRAVGRVFPVAQLPKLKGETWDHCSSLPQLPQAQGEVAGRQTSEASFETLSSAESESSGNDTEDISSAEQECCNQPLFAPDGSAVAANRGNAEDAASTGEDKTPASPSRVREHKEAVGTASEPETGVARDETLRAALEVMLFPPEKTAPEDIEKAFGWIAGALFQDKHLRAKVLEQLLQEVYRSMTDFMENGFVQVQACAVIARIATGSKPVQRAVADTDGIRHIIEALMTHKDSSVVQDKGVHCLLMLTPDAKARAQLTEQKGAECVIWAMKEFQDSREIALNGSKMLINIAFGSEEGKKRVGKVGGIDAIVTAMYVHTDDAELLTHCCHALRNLTFGMRTNQWIAGRSCAMEAILKSMNAFPNEEILQYQGCVALENICAAEPENRDRATEIGVLDVVCTLLIVRDEAASLVEHALGLLRNVCIGSKENQAYLGGEGAIQIVMSALKTHRLNEKVLIAGCGFLRYMFFSKPNRDIFCENKGLPRLLDVLRDGADISAVSEVALLALGNAITDNQNGKKIVARYGGIASVVDTMSNHLDHESIQEYGCRALRNLADSDELNTRLLGESGAIDTAIIAMMGYSENAAVQEQACAMMFNMAFSDANIRLMKHLEVPRVVQHALSFHVQNTKIESHANALLLRINPGGPDWSPGEQLGTPKKVRTKSSLPDATEKPVTPQSSVNRDRRKQSGRKAARRGSSY